MSVSALPRCGPRPLNHYSAYYQMFAVDNLSFDPHASSLKLDFLMPNGIIIQHHVSTAIPLSEVKAEIWEKASEFPLFGLLSDQTLYHFKFISAKAETIELLEERLCLSEINLFMNVLQVVKRNVDDEEKKKLDIKIGDLINKNLTEFEALQNPEVNDFRWKMRIECDEVVHQRNNLAWEERMQYLYPCRLAPTEGLPKYITDRMHKNELYVNVQFMCSENAESLKFLFCVSPFMHPNELLEKASAKRLGLSTAIQDRRSKEMADNHILKVLGQEEYLIKDVPISQYMCVRDALCHYQAETQPFQLIALEKDQISVEIGQVYDPSTDSSGLRPSRTSFSASTMNKKKSINYRSSWTVNENFKFRIGTLSKINVESEDSEISVEVGLYHAGVPQCHAAFTPKVSVKEGIAEADCEIEFPVQVCNLPRSTRLCLAVYEHPPQGKSKSRLSGREDFGSRTIAWVNTSVYDYRGNLNSGSITLYGWSVSDNQFGELEFPNALGTVVSNPNHASALAITMIWEKYFSSTIITYPAKEVIITNYTGSTSENDEAEPDQEKKELLKHIADRDSLETVYEQEKKDIWTFRHYCRNEVSHILPRLLQCVEWNKNEEVAEMLLVLDKWPKLSANRALELLDYAYAEPAVRNYAIDCLSHMGDDEVLLYLLQLVQALKHEMYLYCDLVQFLLERSLKNRRIGHVLFWHLRSEMHVPSVAIFFGLILEAYCRGAIEHVVLLQRQQDSVQNFRGLQDIVRESKGVREKAIASLRAALQSRKLSSELSNFVSPIEPIVRIGAIKIDKCKAMDSKMQPLWFVFGNSDPLGEDVYLLYKKGDDLRQDMLTLQMIKIMDKLWKEDGLDLRLTPYNCLSTDHREGMIQVVHKAQTIATIQRQKGNFAKGTAPLRKSSLLDWLRDHNETDGSLNRAVHEFTLSCAGYSVATYVLGIGDRHNDNIMIMPTGQLFHIDFGHILGHFKSKFGIKRERQPFVLTHDFIYVIQKGEQSKSKGFEEFKKCCEQAFMILRRYGSFIISLFAMMISTGLPELQSEKHLEYLKETLKLDLDDDQALKHFRTKFTEALSNSWKTSFNWMIHSMAKNNG